MAPFRSRLIRPRLVNRSVLLASLCLFCGSSCAEPVDVKPDAFAEQIERTALNHLRAGRQAEAEAVLEEWLDHFGILNHAIDLMRAEQRTEAVALVKQQPGQYRDLQRVLFLRAACIRSRFMIAESLPMFGVAFAINPKTPAATCAMLVALLDNHQEVDKRFAHLNRLADACPDDTIIRWMLAVECRNYDRNEEGARHYKKVLEKWKPGPSLVHQTYGNLLDNLQRYDEALVERRQAVRLEPACWSYHALGNTLASLKRFDEANDAYKICTTMSPNRSKYWGTWAHSLRAEGRLEESIDKARWAISLNSQEYWGWLSWAECLDAQGKYAEALDKYHRALELLPTEEKLQRRVREIEKQVGKA